MTDRQGQASTASPRTAVTTYRLHRCIPVSSYDTWDDEAEQLTGNLYQLTRC